MECSLEHICCLLAPCQKKNEKKRDNNSDINKFGLFPFKYPSHICLKFIPILQAGNKLFENVKKSDEKKYDLQTSDKITCNL